MTTNDSRWLGSEEQWPKHSRPEADKALDHARASGFEFRPATNHGFGRLRCGDPDGDCCLSIYSTSGSHDGSDTANTIRQFVKKCPHAARREARDEATATLAETALLLSHTPRLLDAAEKLIEEAVERRLFEHLVATAGTDEDLEEAMAAEARADVAKSMGLVFASEVGAFETWPPVKGAMELLDAVTLTFAEVEAVIHTLAAHVSCDALVRELSELRQRHTGLIGRLG